jgi:hypothetical protein
MTQGIAKTARTLASLALLAALAAAPSAVAQDGPTLSLHFAHLAPLDEASEGLYEGWAIVDGAPVSTGVFNVNADGEPIEPGGGAVIEEFPVTEDVAMATEIKISIEPADDGDPAPSGLIILGGALQDDMAELHTGLGDVAAASGCYVLATPSDNHEDDMNDHQGIWWLTMPGPEPGLMDLPDLGSAWTYEGWVVDTSGGTPMPYSTGTFASGDMADSDQAGPMGGGPPLPGQDFVAYQGGPVLDLASGDFAAVISIEPVPDNSPAPFQLKPLAGMIGEGCSDGCVENQTDTTFPTGQAMLNQTVPVAGSSLSGVKDLFR